MNLKLLASYCMCIYVLTYINRIYYFNTVASIGGSIVMSVTSTPSVVSISDTVTSITVASITVAYNTSLN